MRFHTLLCLSCSVNIAWEYVGNPPHLNPQTLLWLTCLCSYDTSVSVAGEISLLWSGGIVPVQPHRPKCQLDHIRWLTQSHIHAPQLRNPQFGQQNYLVWVRDRSWSHRFKVPPTHLAQSQHSHSCQSCHFVAWNKEKQPFWEYVIRTAYLNCRDGLAVGKTWLSGHKQFQNYS